MKLPVSLLIRRLCGRSPRPDPPPLIDGPALRNRRPWAGFSSISAALTACFTLATGGALAGDILRGGAPAGGRPPASGSGNGPAAAEAARAAANARDALARTSQAIKSVRDMQAAARKMAEGKNSLGVDPNHPGLTLPQVPNGLVTGGLEVAPGATVNSNLWKGANLPVQSKSGGKTQVDIRQTTAQAVLNWKTFNVGKDTTVYFDQRLGGNQKSQWIAFNKISDPTGVPSQILGQIKAEGQVYLINTNGIIFGGASQVNTHALVASSLPINDNLINRGLLNNPDQQFLFSSLAMPAGTNGTSAFTPPAPPAGLYGDVTVQAGAQLSAPTTPEKVGGRVALVGTNVTNAGTISTPDGQTILAAGQQIGFTAHASSDPSLRGLDTFIGRADVGGKATNTGSIDAPRGTATIAGREVNHTGVIASTTSVTLNGRVDLLAEYNSVPILDTGTQQLVLFPSSTGRVTIGPNSAIEILPEWSSTETATGTTLPLQSQLKIDGLAIHLAGSSSILLPSGKVDLNAGTWRLVGTANVLTYDQGQVYLDPGAMINVAGSTNIAVPITQNILTLSLRGAELADSPLQRDGVLRGTSIVIDLRDLATYNGQSWIGTALGNVSGYANLIQKKVGEFTTGGGTINIRAGESVVLQPGSKLDVSGGFIDYQEGLVQTTRVISGNRLIDISDATPDRIYEGIYTGTTTETHARYGITRTYAQPLALLGAHFEQGYTQGGNGGAIAIAAPAMAIGGELLGNTVAGPRQVRATAKSSSLPVASSLAFSFQGQLSTTPYQSIYPSPTIVFQNRVPETPAAPFALDANGSPVVLDYGHRSQVILSPELFSSAGFGSLTVNNVDGAIVVPEDVSLKTLIGGTISFSAANVSIAGTVTAPGGTLTFRALNISPHAAELAAIDKTPLVASPGRGNFNLASSAALSTAGLLINDRPGAPDRGTSELALKGGGISIAAYSANLAAGSVIDVSGGVLASGDGKWTYGNAGSIAIKTGQDPEQSGVLGGKLVLGSTLLGYSGAQGGSLSLQAGLIQVGGHASRPEVFVLAPSFFSTGGFGSFAITGLGEAIPGPLVKGEAPAVYIAPKTILEPVARSVVAVLQPDTGLVLQPIDKPVGLRTPVSLQFSAPGVTDSITSDLVVRGDIVLDSGAVIRTDPRASVTLSGQTAAVLGSIYAPGGKIAISGGGNSVPLFKIDTNALTTVYIGSQSVLSTAGTTLLTPDAYGRRLGSVLPGGTISVFGNIVAAAGAVLDVSGTSGMLDLAPASVAPVEQFAIPSNSGLTASLDQLRGVPTRVDSDGGSITLKGATMLFSDATLLGRAGGSTALDGSLAVSSGRFYGPQSGSPLPQDSNLVVTQQGAVISQPLPNIPGAIGLPVLSAENPGLISRGYFAVDTFTRGGFDSLTLGGSVEFSGPVDIRARQTLKVADGGILQADSTVHLTAPYVALGTPFQAPGRPEDRTSPFATKLPPTFGLGQLTVTADLIDIGDLSLQNIGQATLVANHGDIRGNGTFNIAGDLVLEAAQIYPTTASSFTIVSYDHNGTPGSVTIRGSGAAQLPLSAGGTLNIYASKIDQGGVLHAPLGTINLGWDGTGSAPVDLLTGNTLPFPITDHLTLRRGSTTSVSAIDPSSGRGVLIPYGISLDGNSWIDPRGIEITSGGLPAKGIRLGAANLSTEAGSMLDVRGGGDLYAYRWVQGNGGSTDILASNTSFAIVPNYDAVYAPYAPFNASTASTNLISGPGYANAGLNVGDRIYLAGSASLAAGYYTLLPARYALLPGAVLVTPKSGGTIGTVELPEGASVVSGYRFNDLNATRHESTVATRFEVASASVVRARAQYEDYLANTFLKESATRLGITVPRLPTDSGALVFQATQSMSLLGTVAARSISAGRGAAIDISSPLEFLITARGGQAAPGQIVLSAATLNGYGAESLLIGGTRQKGTAGTTINVSSSKITVDNAGVALSGPDIILAAKQELKLAPGAQIVQSGRSADDDSTLLIGDSTVAGSGDGLLIRVTSDPNAQIIRSGISASTVPVMTIGAGVLLSGDSVTLDSTARTTLDPTARLLSDFITLNSGRISLVLDGSVALQPDPGLVLAGEALAGLQAASGLSLTSYSTLDLYGTGEFRTTGQFALHAAEIRGFTGGGTITFAAPEIILDNRSNGTGPGAVIAPGGTLVLDAETIRLGAGAVKVDQFASVLLQAPGGVTVEGTGSFTTQSDLTIATPVITGEQAAKQTITAGGAFIVQTPAGGGGVTETAGLGASLTLAGTSLAVNADILLPSGSLTLHATTGSVVIGDTAPARLNVAGMAQDFYDVTKYTDGGQVNITSDGGSVTLAAGSLIDVAAAAGGGDAGSLSINTPNGTFTLAGTLSGQGGAGGQSGSFSADTLSLADVSPVNDVLNAAAFNQSRAFRVRTGDVAVNGLIKTRDFVLSADQGSITVSGTGLIDASGATGGSITLSANGSVTLQSGSLLTVAGADFSAAGKGGDITIEAGSQRNGIVGPGSVDIQTGSTLDLSVASLVAGDAITVGSSAYEGNFSGKLHLRAPQFNNGGNLDVRVAAINGSILGASSILVEGYRLFDLTNTAGVITNTGSTNAAGGLMTASQNVQASINAAGQNFIGTAGTGNANYNLMINRLLGAGDPQGLLPIFVLAPGAEVINRVGDLTLGSTSSTTTADWNLATFRYGAKSAPGVLTLRAAGNLVFYNALSDGFTPTLANTNTSWLWTARLATQNAALPVNTQSWSYRLTAGADLTGANSGALQPVSSLAEAKGFLQLGKNNGQNQVIVNTGAQSSAAQTATAIANRFQVIRTGTGDIEIHAGRSVQLLNHFATIYTAGSRVTNPTLDGNFDTPVLPQGDTTGVPDLGSNQQVYPALYSMAGGNVSIFAQQNIEHLTRNAQNELVPDSQFQMPTNWLYDRGYVGEDGNFATLTVAGIPTVASTTWWIDFSNFFQGIGALGGGDVTLTAGQNVSNVDAVIPTNARMTKGTPAAANLLELGGGDLTVIAGVDIDAGVYYVERGQGTLKAGGEIKTNATRELNSTTTANATDSPTWLPTTLFVGQGSFDVSARGDVLIGPVANPFFLPAGLNNNYIYKSYFSTYSPDSAVTLSSLGGDVTMRTEVALGGSQISSSILQEWYANKLLWGASAPLRASYSRPWLRLNESSVQPFGTVAATLPPTLAATAFSGDINLAGDLILSPAPLGGLELLAQGAINGLQPTGSTSPVAWTYSTINVSDASPSAIRGVTNPYAYDLVVAVEGQPSKTSTNNFLKFFDDSLLESGGTAGADAVLQTKQARHAAGLLHLNDPNPVRLYTGSGDISGLTLFSPKAAQIFSAQDISDVSFYIQQVAVADVSMVSSGRDLIPFNANSPLRVLATTSGNAPLLNGNSLAGDIQIAGPGTLEVLAGRNLDLGTGTSNSNGTGVGITSVGNARNPALPFEGASIIVGAGIGPSAGLAHSDLQFENFLAALGPDVSARYLAELSTNGQTVDLDSLTSPEREQLALRLFYLVLRDAGRNYLADPGTGYAQGFAAIAALFPEPAQGDILTRGRDIRTKSGGRISVFAPGGKLTLANTAIGNPLAPPGIITESGGDISIFTDGDVDLGIGRIFTLRGGSQIIWSSTGNIAAGSAAKTVQSAPPTRVLIDPQSADVTTDLAGLATGGGIGVLATVGGVLPGSVDLIAPTGVVDAGDAGIRATGDLNIAAVKILNADNIQVGGTTTGVPSTPTIAAPNLGGLTAANNTAGAANAAASEVARQQQRPEETTETPSIITVEVLGYGGSEDSEVVP